MKTSDPQVSESGMVTTEFALALIPFAIIVMVAMSGIAVAGAHIEARSASTILARAAGQGYSSTELEDLAQSLLPGAAVEVHSEEQLVTVRLTYRTPGIRAIFGVITAQSTALREPGTVP